MMSKKKSAGYAVLILVAVLMVGGCAVFPKVTYLSPSNEDAEGAIKFYLQGSLVMLGAPKEDSAEGIKTEKATVGSVPEIKDKGIRAVVTPAESKKHLYALKPHESIWSKTSVSVSYRDNTRLIKSIGTNFKDNRIAVIKTVGAIVASVASGGILKGVDKRTDISPPELTEKESLHLPVVIDLSDIKEGQSTSWKNMPGQKQWWYKLALDSPPLDSIPASEYFATTRVSRALAYSACQDATLFVTNLATQPSGDAIKEAAAFNVRIANPNYVCTLNLPAKGSITMHSICGADIKPEEYADVSSLDILDALMKQVEAIRQAQTE